MKEIKYVDSYGRKVGFSANPISIRALRRRNPIHVYNEVLEVLDRRAQKGGKSVQLCSIAFELLVSPHIINKAFKVASKRGLLKKEGHSYKIMRLPSRGDYVQRSDDS